MTRDELKDLACLGFSADLVMQSFCHTAAYPKPVDVKTHRSCRLHQQPWRRGAAPGRRRDPLWLNRLLLPDTVGTGGDSHPLPHRHLVPGRFRPGGLRRRHRRDALDMPESVLVRFKGKMQPGVTLRDLVHAIPLYAIKAGPADRRQARQEEHLLSGRILEIEGLPDLKVEQAFELSDASAERSAAGCTVKLNKNRSSST